MGVVALRRAITTEQEALKRVITIGPYRGHRLSDIDYSI
jgi:hypothetical protein